METTEQKKEEKTFSVALTWEEGAVLGLNLLQLNMLSRAGLAQPIAPEVLMSIAKKLKEATSATSEQSTAGESGPQTSSGRSDSSGESSGAGQVPVPEPQGLDS